MEQTPSVAQCAWLDFQLAPMRHFLEKDGSDLAQAILQHLTKVSVEFAVLRWKYGLPISDRNISFEPKIQIQTEKPSPKPKHPIQTKKLVSESRPESPVLQCPPAPRPRQHRKKIKKVTIQSIRNMSKAEYKKRFGNPKQVRRKVNPKVDQPAMEKQTRRSIVAMLKLNHFEREGQNSKGKEMYARTCCSCGQCSFQFDPICDPPLKQRIELRIGPKQNEYYKYKVQDIQDANNQANVVFKS